MTSTQRFTIFAILPRLDGKGEYFARVGKAFRNKDASLNAFVDMIPVAGLGGKPLKLQIREWDERDERPRDSVGSSRDVVAPGYGTVPELASTQDSPAARDLPF